MKSTGDSIADKLAHIVLPVPIGYSMRVSVRKNQLKGQLIHGVVGPI